MREAMLKWRLFKRNKLSKSNFRLTSRRKSRQDVSNRRRVISLAADGGRCLKESDERNKLRWIVRS